MLNSIYIRLLGLVAIVVVGTIVLLSIYFLLEFEEASLFHMKHEAAMFSDTVKSSIAPLLTDTPSAAQLQAYVDRVTSSREKNDIEINIMLVEGHKSSIVASNIPDNIGRPSIYEHKDMLKALEDDRTIWFVGRDDDSPSEVARPPGHPDYHIAPGHRFISVTRPLAIDGRRLGAINTKISLFHIDQEMGAIRRNIVLAGLLLPILAVGLMGLAVRAGLNPLERLAESVARVEPSNLNDRFETSRMPRELLPIGEGFNEMLQRLETAFQRERRFTADVAHELRTPIATLKTIAQVGIQEMGEEGQDTQRDAFFKDTLEISRQMEHLVNNLMVLVRLEGNQVKVQIETFDLKELVEGIWESFRSQAEENRIAWQLHLPDSIRIRSDRNMTEAILRNLLSNSVCYTTEEGSISCSGERIKDRVSLELENTTDRISKEDLEHLFEPFWRKDDARTDSRHCGVGLSVVSAYAQVLGVAIDVDLPRDGVFRVQLSFGTTEAG